MADEMIDRVRGSEPSSVEQLEALLALLREHSPAAVAFSGGVDSALLAYLASRIEPRTLCVTASSETYTEEEMERAKRFAERHGLRHMVIETREMEDPLFIANTRDRCYHCKRELFRMLREAAAADGLSAVLYGANRDDLCDHRPGHRAAEEAGAFAPFIAAGMGKEEIRRISRALGLETWDLPQSACLASRIPYGQELTREILSAVADAERLLRDAGHRQVRVRAHGSLARIEIADGEAIDLSVLRAIAKEMKPLGFTYVTLDLEGYRSGSMNEG
ncbi:MAG: ATP-dependent sacrificial sulfur transferase LarE [Candidatus Thermoplasmatota archaeon]